MFDIPDTKVFMDSVHGYISVPKTFVDHLIDTEAFQRLRNIDQTGMRILYPTAKHDRFSHSLGVFHLGCRAVDTLLQNFSYEDYWNISSNNAKVIFWAKNKVLFLIACLLHDIGHTPYSHSLEQIVLENSKQDDVFFTRRLIEILNEKECWEEEIKDIKAAPHEQIGSMYILEHMEEAVSSIFDDLVAQQYPVVGVGNILYAEHYHYNPVIDKEDLQRDLCFIARMILGLKYEGYEPEKQIRNCFIDLLNGGNFDVDKLDYVLRDTQMSGISNTGVDAERLLSSVCIITKTKYIDRDYHQEEVSNCVISKLVGDDAEQGLKIYGNFRGTLVIGGKARVCLAVGSTFISLSMADGSSKIRCLDPERAITFSEDTEIIQNGRRQGIVTLGGKNAKILSAEQGVPFSCTISNGKVTEGAFEFEVNDLGGRIHVQIHGYCNIHIWGSCTNQSPIICFSGTRLEGHAKEMVLLGNKIKRENPGKNTYNEFSVGFKKKAINVIANVLEAKDYLYLWIYAHHKVVYYANFLVPVVLPQVLKLASEQLQLPVWLLNYENISKLDDSYLWTIMKYFYYRGECKDIEVSQLCEELLSRKYKVSLYKSLAEYDLLFESFKEEEREYIQDYIGRHMQDEMPKLLDQGIVLAGYLENSIVEKLKQKEGLQNVNSLIFVRANYKVKDFNTEETFIEMNPGRIASIDEIPLLAKKVAKSRVAGYYFYLYYATSTQDADKIKEETVLLKDAIKDFFSEVCQGIREV